MDALVTTRNWGCLTGRLLFFHELDMYSNNIFMLPLHSKSFCMMLVVSYYGWISRTSVMSIVV
jgi:hypothetical protein